MFSVRSGLVLFSSNRPGSHVAMFGPDGQKLAFRGDASHFDDGARAYTWAFDYLNKIVDGETFVFATMDRVIVGEVSGNAIRQSNRIAYVTREEGRPISVNVSAPKEKLITLATTKLPTDLSTTSVKCLFVNPSVPYGQWACLRPGVMNEASFSSHGMAYVSATLKNAGHECWMIDLRSLSNWAHVESVLRQEQYDVAFVGFLSIDVFNASGVVRLLKELHPNRPVVVGGLHVSIAKEHVFPRPDLIEHYCFGNEDLLPGSFKEFLAWKGEASYAASRFPLADYVILDDGEIAARDLVAELAAGRSPASRTIDGGAVPMEVARHMDRDLFDLNVEAYSPILPFQPVPMATVTWARGCPFHCTYCNLSSQLSNTNVRTKPPELVREELEDLHSRLGGHLGSIMVHDDLTFHARAIADWCEVILSRWNGIPMWLQTRAPMVIKWYKKDRAFWELLCRAGLVWVSVGYESGSQRMLDYMKKDSSVEENIECGRILDEYGINSFGNFLWGVPGEEPDDAEATVQLVEKIRPGYLSGSVYCSYPGTAQDKECREKDMIVKGSVYERSHLPWQYTIKGIDYAHVFDCRNRAGQHASYLRMPKLLNEDRQRELAATARGLPIH